MATLTTLSAICPSPAPSFRKTMPIRSHQNRPYKVEEDSDDEDEEVISKVPSEIASNPVIGTSPSKSKTESSANNASPTAASSPFTQEEEEIRRLQTSGALNHVAGETSMLSQEILDISQISQQEAPCSQMNPTKMGLITTQEETTNGVPRTPKKKRQGRLQSSPSKQQQKPGDESQQSTMQSSQLSVLMDAAEIMAGLEGRQHTVDGVPIPDSYVADESQASTVRSSSRLAANKAASQSISPAPTIRFVRGTTSSKTKTKENALLPRTKAIPTDTIHVKATPTSMVIKLPNSSNSSNPKKRKETSVLQPNNKRLTSFKSARNCNNNNVTNTKGMTNQKKRKLQREKERRSAHEMAQQAAQLAAQTIASPEVAKNLLLSMALVRINPRAAPSEWPRRGAVITDGFFWGTYPPLETILRSHMREYYELSTTKCQSKLQQQFNNSLTIEIREESANYGWEFAQNFDDKVLRDRIRCFFKTHIQNAKKRLRTMLKNPTKKANAKALVAHLALIQRYSKEDDEHKPIYNPVIGDLVKVDVPDNVDETTMRKIKRDDDDYEYDDTGDQIAAVDGEADVMDAKQMLNLGFQNLSQDDKITEQQAV